MDSASSELLSSFIEVGIGIAGFSSIVAAISRGHWSILAKVIFPQLLHTSAIIILFSSLPLLFEAAGLDRRSTWSAASTFSAIYLIVLVPLRVVKLLDAGIAEAGLSPWSGLLRFIVLVLPPVLYLVNASILQQPWPYLAAITVQVLYAFVQFYSLLTEFWK